MTTNQVPPDGPRTLAERGRSHGRPASWMLVAVVLCASVAAGVALIIHVWPLFWACVAVAGAGIPAGKIIGIMDDTVAWGRAPPVEQQSPSGGVVPAHPRGRAGASGSLPEGSREDPAGPDLSRIVAVPAQENMVWGPGQRQARLIYPSAWGGGLAFGFGVQFAADLGRRHR